MNLWLPMMLVAMALILIGSIIESSDSARQTSWLRECAQHRPLVDCKADYNVLKQADK